VILNVISGRSTRKTPKTSRVPRSPFVIFLVHFFQWISAGCGAHLSPKKGKNWLAFSNKKVPKIFHYQSLRNGPAQTGADRRRPAQTGADRRRPAQTGADRRRPAIFSTPGRSCRIFRAYLFLRVSATLFVMSNYLSSEYGIATK